MPLDVALACNGLRMLMTMAATITATIILIPLPTWKRITLLASTVPIAMLSNMIRIVATGWCYYEITGPTAKQWAHDVSGLADDAAGTDPCVAGVAASVVAGARREPRTRIDDQKVSDCRRSQ